MTKHLEKKSFERLSSFLCCFLFAAAAVAAETANKFNEIVHCTIPRKT